MKNNIIPIVLLVIVICLVSVLFGMMLGDNPAPDEFACPKNIGGYGGDNWFLPKADILACAECNAPMWSDAWCELCYALWLEVK